MAVDINNLKTQLKSIFDTANTTTADYDLSNNMNVRVKNVLTVNPIKLPVQPSFFPYVTIYPGSKGIELATIAKNQLQAKRFAELTINVVGVVMDQIISSPLNDDPDDELENLMENVEELLRRNHTINGAAKWTLPDSTEYHAFPVGEESAMRAGLFQFTAKIDY